MNEGGWLSTRNKTKVTQPSGRGIKKKRSSTVKPLKNVKLSLDDSPPPRQLFTATKQSSLNDFFTSNKDHCLENEVHIDHIDFNNKDHASKLSQKTETDNDSTVLLQENSKEESCKRSDYTTSIEQFISGRTSNTAKNADTDINSSDDAGTWEGDLDLNLNPSGHLNVFKKLKKACLENDQDEKDMKNEERFHDRTVLADRTISSVGDETSVIADKNAVDKKQKHALKRPHSSSSESDGDCGMFPKRFKDKTSSDNKEIIGNIFESRNINFEKQTVFCGSKCEFKRDYASMENSPANVEKESQIVSSVGKQQEILDDIHMSYFDKHSLDLGTQMSQDNLLGNEPEIELVLNRKFDLQSDEFSSVEENKTRKQNNDFFRDSPSFVSNTQVKNFLLALDKENITFNNTDEDTSLSNIHPNNLKKSDEESPTCSNNTIYTPSNNTQVKNYIKYLDGKDITFGDSDENTPVILGDTQIALLQEALETSSLRLSSQSLNSEDKL